MLVEISYGSHRGIALWHTVTLVSFMAIAIGLASVVMGSGFLSSEQTKEIVIEAVREAHYGLEVVGKISGMANVSDNKILTTSTPISSASDGFVVVSKDRLNLNYNLVKIQNYIISYDNIYTGSLPSKSYNDPSSAIADAKQEGLIEFDPYEDKTPPSVTSAFIYWILNLNFDEKIDEGELAVLTIIYAEKDRPSTDEHLKIEGMIPEGKVLTIERTIPHISHAIVDFGGTVNPKN